MVFEILQELDIPILCKEKTGMVSGRKMSSIIDDLISRWRKCTNLETGRMIVDVLQFMTQNQDEPCGDITAVVEEQERLEKAALLSQPDTELDEFLSSFKIVGGDAL